MALLLNSLWLNRVNGEAPCEKSLISTRNTGAVQLTSALISLELQPLLWFIKQINHTSQALIYLWLPLKYLERESLGECFHPLPCWANLQGLQKKKKKNGLHASIQLTKIKILKFSRSQWFCTCNIWKASLPIAPSGDAQKQGWPAQFQLVMSAGVCSIAAHSLPYQVRLLPLSLSLGGWACGCFHRMQQTNYKVPSEIHHAIPPSFHVLLGAPVLPQLEPCHGRKRSSM